MTIESHFTCDVCGKPETALGGGTPLPPHWIAIRMTQMHATAQSNLVPRQNVTRDFQVCSLACAEEVGPRRRPESPSIELEVPTPTEAAPEPSASPAS